MKSIRFITLIVFCSSVYFSAGWSQPVTWADLNIDGEYVSFEQEKITPVIKKMVVKEPKSRLSEADIKRIAEEFHLQKETATNPHLIMMAGDIAHWYEQNLGENNLRLQFAARKVILDAAEGSSVVIKDQGVLSWAAQQIMRNLLLEKKNL